ncbi:Multidrug efflux pump subunit AcrB [Geoalkalibacter ferrihydriticus]|uniref:Acriflavin resistance protein n=2 Tax=Geoalkalibacter ferrihydriticus TaxID=392333 RepID=A0A0C2DRL4_9BACT|nr:efflux RND transporter permease subunit [Geoalkalibacter ferrihydriticus]KIH76099.1 acriflavin resistance protein [Geoalkalibacter ferrihydriticus DSM 17813]SDM45660.1 Multidrug efflux pump subunit AcrB [Geoalkalibacter ferrihydriticus]
MNGPIRWMARNHVAANLLMLIFVVGGLIMATSIKQEIFPEVSLDTIQVSVAYPGAGPEEIEDGILLQIEDVLTEVDGIREIRATAIEGMGMVNAVLRTGENPDIILQDVKSAVDRIITFPEDAERPVITKLLNRREVVSVVVYGELSDHSLRERAELIRDELLDFEQITQVELGGMRPYEISIEISEENLRRYDLTLDQVAQRVRRASLDLPGGAIKTAGGEILLRTMERRYFGPGYADISLITRPDGTQVRLGDLAEVRDDFRETDTFARFDDQPAAMIKVYRVGEQKPTEISEIVTRYVADKRLELPPSVSLGIWNDTSELLESRMNLLIKNALIGLVLVFIILGLFLEIRLALWVMLGIPVSFLGAMLFMPAMDVSINMISLFAFIMALGIVVDDAIVVGENVFDHRQMGKPYLKAAMDGAVEVGRPVIFSVLTTITAFMPLVFVSGMMGKFIGVIPLVVISILVVSLIEVLFVLPAHLSLGGPRSAPGGILGSVDRTRRRFGRALDRFIAGPYRRVLTACLRFRYATVAAAIACLLLSVGLVGGGFIRFLFMPVVDGDVILVSVEMPPGTPVEITREVQEHIVDQAYAVIAEHDQANPGKPSILRNIYALVGTTMDQGGPNPGDTSSGAHLADIALFLQPSEERDIAATEISQRWRRLVGEVPGARNLTFKSNLMMLGANIDVQLAHQDFNVLQQAAAHLKEALAGYPGVSDIVDNYAPGKRELKLRLTPEALTLGITEEDLGRQVRAAFHGAEALRLQRGRNEVRVMVRYPEEDRRSLWDFEQMRIRTPDGGELPLDRAAFVSEGRGYSQINRSDRKRVINISADVDEKTANANQILQDLQAGFLPQLRAEFPGLNFDLEGEEKERRDSVGSMRQGFALALFGIYALLAIPFRSYSQPLLIMSAIPFGAVGAILGHLLMGYDLTILSLFGIVALSGVVVNASLLLIDRINRSRRDGKDLLEAVIEGSQRRFRPILLTSLTTFFGLAPMILETSVQAKFLIPMAISLGFGVLFSTGITLLLLPCLYVVLEDIRGLFGLRPTHGDHQSDLESPQT